MGTLETMMWAKSLRAPLDAVNFGSSRDEPGNPGMGAPVKQTEESRREQDRLEAAHNAAISQQWERAKALEVQRLDRSPDRWVPGQPPAPAMSAPAEPITLRRSDDPKPGLLDRLGFGAKPVPERWSTDQEASAIQGLRKPSMPDEQDPSAARRRDAERTPHLALGISVAGGFGPYAQEAIADIVPALKKCQIDSQTSSGRKEHQSRWDIIAMSTAVTAREWRDRDGSHGLGQELGRGVREAAIDRLAWRGASIRDAGTLDDQLDASAKVVEHRTALYLSNGPAIEAALPEIARRVDAQGRLGDRFAHLGGMVPEAPGGDTRERSRQKWIVEALRTERAMAQTGMLAPLDVARLAMREDNRALDGIDRNSVQRAYPSFAAGRDMTPDMRTRAIGQALERQTAPVQQQARTAPEPVARAMPAMAAAMAARDGRQM